MVAYTLTYFDVRGRAELSRLLFAAADKTKYKFTFEDKRLSGEEWGKFKEQGKCPYGQLPILEFDGKVLTESNAVARFLAREFGMAGKDSYEQAICDQIIELLEDMFKSVAKTYFEKDEKKKEEMLKNIKETELPKFIGHVEKAIKQSKGKYLIGDSLTVADLAVLCAFDAPCNIFPNLLDSNQPLAKFRANIAALPGIKEYIAGQNKNCFIIAYLQWRVMTGRQDAIEYLIQFPDHARCLVDGGFGHLKKLYRRSNIETLDQLVNVVERSSSTNEAIRYPQWQWRDWKRYLGPLFHPIPGIRKYQYFRMTKDEPGIVTIRAGADEAEQKINIAVRGLEITNELPPILEAAGLSHARSQYLYRVVRPYLSHASRDITCSAPAPME